jgi:hypothetical protein
VARQGEQAAELIDQVVNGLEALAKDPRTGRKRYRVALQEAIADYSEKNRSKDRRRVSNTKGAALDDGGTRRFRGTSRGTDRAKLR